MLDFWYYDEQEFEFLDGRMLLRGANGSGKSVTMQSFIPLLLDGNMRPERLDPFGSRARKMENYLLEEGDGREERTGYLYMELKREDSDSYTTIGMGIRARRNKKLDTWYFCVTDGRRVGRNLFLYKDMQNRITCTKQELKNRLGEGGRVMETQGEYVQCVNRLLFGFETMEEYQEMLDLLIQLRTPKLSKDFKPTIINEILSSSLQTLSEEDLRPMSEAIENMDGQKASLDVLDESIRAAEQIEKSFAMYIYDYKFPDLSEIAYNHLLKHKEHYKVRPEFYVINFDDPRRSHRCNPINPKFMADISDAYESAYTIMLNLNKTWIQKQGDFFVESPIILLAAIIWYLRIYKDGKYCTFPHAIEFLNKPYADIFTILTSYPSLENYLSPFMDAWQGGAQDQLQGQIASAKIPLSRMISPQLYWVMTGDDFTLDLNNPEHPKILCVGNNPDRQNIYSAALGLYNSRIVKLVNKKGQLKSSIIIDELPTIYFRGIDNLIATARSNKVAVCLGFQDFSQLTRDYGEKEAKVIQNTVGNIFSGQVVGETAKSLSERFGKILQQRQSISINRQDTSTSINTQLDSLIPASKIANLSQGTFVGSVADNFGEEIEQKIFHARIIVDSEKVAAETKAYKKIPVINEFKDEDGNDIMQQQIDRNYSRIKADVLQIIEEEMARIANDPDLKHLIPQKEDDKKDE